MADGRHLEKFNTRLYLWYDLTNLHEIWHCSAVTFDPPSLSDSTPQVRFVK